jgi:hypothetical protein
MTDLNPYAAPLTDLNVPRDPSEIGVWRDGAFLVMSKGAELPDRCLRCNEPAEGWRLKRKLGWHPPLYYALIIFNILIYAIVAMIVRKTAVVRVPLCARHRGRRRKMIAWGWALGLLGPLAMIAGPLGSSNLGPGLNDGISVASVVLGGLMLLVGLILAIVASQVASPEKIDKTHVWLQKVSPELLDSLPSWSNVLPVTGPNLDNNGMISFPTKSTLKAKAGTERDDLELLPDDEF